MADRPIIARASRRPASGINPSCERLGPNHGRGGSRRRTRSAPTSAARSPNARLGRTQDRRCLHPITVGLRPNPRAARTHLPGHSHPTSKSHSGFGASVTRCARETSRAIQNGDRICPRARCTKCGASRAFPRATQTAPPMGRAFPRPSAISREAPCAFRDVRTVQRSALCIIPLRGDDLSVELCAFRRNPCDMQYCI